MMDTTQTTHALATTTDATIASWETLKEQSKIALRSRYLPKAIQSEEQAITIAMAGRELGIPVMTAFRLIHLIEGKITMAAELLLALAYRKVPGFRLEILKSTAEGCAVRAWRPGMEQPTPPIVFTLEMAHRAGLSGKHNWKAYPEAMCRSRAIAAAVRAVAPDATLGIAATEEVIDGVGFELGVEEPPQQQAPVQQAPATPVDALKAQLRQQPPPPPMQLAAPAAPPPVAKPRARTRTTQKTVETPFGPATQVVEEPVEASADAPPDDLRPDFE